MNVSRLIIPGLLVFAGCAVDQKKEVETYRSVVRMSDERVRHVAGEPLSLTRSLLLANQNNEVLAQKGEEYLRSRIAHQRAFAEFLPTIDLVPVYSRRQNVTSATGNQAQDRSLDVPVDGSINLFNGFRDVHGAWRDELVEAQKRHELLDTQERLLLDTAGVFFQVLRSEASVRVLESSEAVQDERYRDAKGRLDAGLASPLAASQTMAQVAATRTTLISARNDVQQARIRLKLLVNADVGDSRLTDDFDPAALPTLEVLQAHAARSREDLRAAESAVEAAKHDVEVAWGQYYPSITLDVSVYLYRESIPDARKWDGLLQLNLPIFSAGRIEQDVREAWSNLRTALLAREYAARSVRAEVEQAFSALQASDERLSQLQVQSAAAQQTLNQAEQSYKIGLATNLDRVQAQDALLLAQLQLASEQYDRKLFHLTLLQRVGLLREQFEPQPTTQP